jgi:hypothetical protein
VWVRPGGPLRLGGGAVIFFDEKPYAGGRATLGACTSSATMICADLDGTVYVARHRAPEDRVAADLRLVVSVAFRIL